MKHYVKLQLVEEEISALVDICRAHANWSENLDHTDWARYRGYVCALIKKRTEKAEILKADWSIDERKLQELRDTI
jgi:hypothetical protein